jgi:polar amino acid transport system substrate-binding protein
MNKKILSAATCGVLLASILAGCSATNASTASSSAPLKHLLPKAIQTSGVINVASLNDLAPWSSVKGSTWTGIDIDLTDAMGKLLGVKFDYKSYDFSGEIAGLQAKRFDTIINEIGDTTDRESAVSFVDYTQEFTGIIVPTGNPKKILTLGDLCGLTVSVIQGSEPQTQAQEQSTACTSEDKKAITILNVPSVTAMYLAVASGRADATLNGYSAAAYSFTQGGITKGIALSKGAKVQPSLNGFAFNKSNTQLGKALQASLQKLMDNGTYAKILKKWGVSNCAIPKATINGAADYAKAHAGE